MEGNRGQETGRIWGQAEIGWLREVEERIDGTKWELKNKTEKSSCFATVY